MSVATDDDAFPSPETSWLEPLPDAVVWGTPANDPAAAALRGRSLGR